MIKKYNEMENINENSDNQIEEFYPPFSIKTLCDVGELFERTAGEWFSDVIITGVFKKISEYFELFKNPKLNVKIMNYQSCIEIQDILDTCFIKKKYDKKNQKFIRFHDQYYYYDKMGIVFVNVRVGLDKIPKDYYKGIKELFTLKECIGIIGGKTRLAYYFIGYNDDDDSLLYLDPHVTKEADKEINIVNILDKHVNKEVHLLKGKGDIIVEKGSENETGKYLDTQYIKKVIYLQKSVKKYLKKIKSSKNLDNKVKKENAHNSPSSKKIKSSKQTKDSPKESKSKKSKKSDKDNKYITYEEEQADSLLVPTVNTPLMENNIFNDDPFRNKKRSNLNKIENDPRDGPFDGIRRKFPKLKEEQSSYEGEWKDGKRDGFGILCWGDESKFMGLFEDDKVFGYGKLWHDDGDVYKGYWKEFQADGIGQYKTKKGAYFKGEWRHDRQDGFGMENWPKGSNFMGEYVDGNKNGIGILTFENKAGYKGEFKEGIISGIGTFYFGDKRKYHGRWKNNKMHGYGIIVWPGGDVFEGEFYEDKKNGFGIFFNQQKVYMGMWKNNKPDGELVIIDDGKIKKQFWENGKPIKNLEEGYKTKFEKIIDKIIKEQKKKVKRTIEDDD